MFTRHGRLIGCVVLVRLLGDLRRGAEGLYSEVVVLRCRGAPVQEAQARRESMMGRVRGVLGQWGLLAAGLLASAMLVLYGHEARPAQPAPYTIPQVLAGWHRQPAAWAGRTVLTPVLSWIPSTWTIQYPAAAGRTVLVRGTVRDSCDMRRPLGRPVGGPAVPCVLYQSGWPTFFLYDPTSRALLPLYWWDGDMYIWDSHGNIGNDPAVYRVRLRAWSDCGPLGLGQHPCLVGEAPHLVH
jgi:hypothetical protein